MQKKIKNLEDLRSIAFKLDAPIKVHPKTGKFHKISPYFGDDVQKGYYISEGILVFVDGQAMYVLPYFHQILDILENSGFVPKEMFVPFSDGSAPAGQEDIWNKLIDTITQFRIGEFQEKCLAYSKEHNISRIPNDILDKCTERPLITYLINHMYSAFSGIPTIVFDFSKIGTFSVIDGKHCSFVHIDGKTYHSDRIDVYQALIKAGYKAL